MNERPGDLGPIAPLEHVAWARDLATGRVTYLSATLRDFVGAARDAALTWDDLRAAVHPDDAARFDALTLGDGDGGAVTFRYRRGDESRWASARVVRGPTQVDGVVVDVTERVAAEAATSADRRRADALIAVASKISERLEVDEVARVLCAHARWAFGAHVRATFLLYEHGAFSPVHSEGAPPGARPLPAQYPPQPLAAATAERLKYARDAAASSDAALAALGGARGFARALLVHGGELIGALALATFDRPLQLDPADLDLLGGMADQAASAVNNSRVLAESREHARRYRSILDTVFDGINITDFDGVIRYCNHQFAAMVGGTPEEVVGKRTSDLLFPEDLAIAQERIRRRRAGFTTPFTWRLRAIDDGREVLVRANSRELKDEQGRPVAMLGVITDVTRSRRLEERLLQAQKLESLGVLAAGVAHDFNNLTVGILGNAGLALTELPAGSGVRPLLEDVQAAALRASELTRQLLSFSGRGRTVKARLDVGAALRDMLPLLSSAAGPGVTVRLEPAPALPEVEADASQLRQLVLNLVRNGSEAIGDGGGEVVLAASAVRADDDFLADTVVDDNLTPGEYVCIEVRDTGRGIAPEAVARIFDPFYTTKFVGRGLGLAAVLGILRAHRGAVRVHSEPGAGTTLRAYFPAAPPAAPGARDEPARTVLVIDDDEGVRNVARRIFERGGFRVVAVADGRSGVERLRELGAAVSAVLLDANMPELSGEETFHALRAVRPDLRVLLASGLAEQEVVARLVDAGLAGFVEKPFRPQPLLDKVRAMLDG